MKRLIVIAIHGVGVRDRSEMKRQIRALRATLAGVWPGRSMSVEPIHWGDLPEVGWPLRVLRDPAAPRGPGQPAISYGEAVAEDIELARGPGEVVAGAASS